jgi:predicted peptidase
MAQTASVQAEAAFATNIVRRASMRYLYFLPADYAAAPAKRFPLILFLHGAGERGTDLRRVAVHGPPKVAQTRPDFPFMVVSPQCPEGRAWDDAALLALLDDVLQRYRVDPKRVYLTGLSMGGYGTWSLGLSHPERFAAIAPICGGGSSLKVLLPDAERAARLRELPVWAFHGVKDSVVPVEESMRMINALKRAGAQNVQLTLYPDADHDSWTMTYDNPGFYE